MSRGSSVDAAADDLYSLAPREFTAARNGRAKAAMAAGDKEDAHEIAALRKPTVPAWLANQLVRHHADEVRSLLQLGGALREATASLRGPQLRELSRQRNQVVQALVRQARRLAAASGQAVSEEAVRALEGTLNAALADEEVAELVLQGRLSAPLEHTGFGSVGGPGTTRAKEPSAAAPAPRAEAGSPGPSAAEQRRQDRRAELVRDLAVARRAAREAGDARTAAEAAAADAEAASADVRREVDRLRCELAEAEMALAGAEGERAAAVEALGAAGTDAERTTRRASELRHELEQL